MPIFTEAPPLSLYIHLPWCIRKCPYCDFNSHESKGELPESAYVAALLSELDSHLARICDRALISIFFGGGTPSLFSPKAIEAILAGVASRVAFAPEIEITLEANPGAIDQVKFHGYRQAGVNRLSLGIQSLQDEKLKSLGRIHERESAMDAIRLAKEAGFTRYNVDLMYGLPNQTIEDALFDLSTALTFKPPHLSWYQLTIEPNTLFYKQTPQLPTDDHIWEMYQAGLMVLDEAGLSQYEVSAYAQFDDECKHNLNYWQFGDYLGIGAGAHSKITLVDEGKVIRFAQVKPPLHYLDAAKRNAFNCQTIEAQDLIFEFMLNALRLSAGFTKKLFETRTGLSFETIQHQMKDARKKGLIDECDETIIPTELGKQFLNNLTALFLPH